MRLAGVSRVCIVESGRGTSPVGESIPPDTRLLLQGLRLWDAFADEGHDPCPGSCSAWGNPTLGYNDFLLNPYGNGWHLDRRRFDAFLFNGAIAAGVHVMVGTPVRACEVVSNSLVELYVGGAPKPLTTRFAVDATGPRSVIARLFGARPLFLDRLACAYGFFDTAEATSQSRMTLLEADEAGWWYLARLPDGRLAAAFATDPAIVQTEKLADPSSWLARVLRTRHVAQRLDGCRFLPDTLVVRLAPSFRLDHVAGDCWLAVGDAAAAYDPLAAQGIYKALEDGVEAAKAIAAKLQDGADSIPAYAGAVIDRFEEYRTNRNHFYGLEARWPDAPFWKQRRERTDLQTPTLGP